MKVLLINGSPRKEGNTAIALNEMVKVFEKEGIETEIMHIGGKDIRGCIACGKCRQLGHCVFDDAVVEAGKKLAQADGLVVGSPVYYASANGTVTSFMDRLFYSNSSDLRMKVGAAIAVARRGGQTTTFDQLNKYFTISGMPVASGQYWNGVHGSAPGEAEQDSEGLQQMRTLASNMAFLMKSIALGKDKFGLPEREAPQRMNFIR
ncbi:MAG: flavodoxin family protein [Oscillospiraceae bacterium]|nr:flavodoxin family protein [Oscillospiraceae bacterium]MBR6610359.1 flavodoxin family protein [Oscillospiraceae bacterium]